MESSSLTSERCAGAETTCPVTDAESSSTIQGSRLLEQVWQRIRIHRDRMEALAQLMEQEMRTVIGVRDYRVLLVLSGEYSKHRFALSEFEILLERSGE